MSTGSLHRRRDVEYDAPHVGIASELKERGKTPYEIPTGGSNGIGAMGYANFMRELAEQSEERGHAFDAIVTASGSGGTQGGLVLGRKLFGASAQIVGISDGEPSDELAPPATSYAVASPARGTSAWRRASAP